MKRAQVTIKNYRGFSDSEPARLEIGPGFTALLGKNNSGKSSSKLFFYELRPLFEIMSRAPNTHPGIQQVVTGVAITTEYLGITDVTELFNNTNDRPIVFEIELLDRDANIPVVSRIVGSCDRANPKLWKFEIFGAAQTERSLKGGGISFESIDSLQHQALGAFRFREMREIIVAIRDARYYGPFRNAINQGAGEHFDLRVGTSFIDLWNEWKTSGVKAKLRAIDQVTEEIRSLFEFGRLEVNASITLKTLLVSIDGQSYRLGELGSGLSQFIIVLGNAATTKPSLLLIDEPETNLHPALQIDFLLSVAHYARYGCVFSTHSIGLARSVADRIYSFQKKAQQIVVRPFEATTNYLEFIGELSFSVFKEIGCDRILLVEGVNDVKTVQQLLRLVKKEHTTVILPLGGDQLAVGGREAELHELKRLTDQICVLVDSEKSDASAAPSERRLRFQESCKKLGFDVCITERRAIENYFSDRAVKAALGASFQSLGPYDLLSDSSNGWRKSESWKVARQTNFEELRQTDLGNFIERI
jgi:energy-coupling factor transporter ATP-binding protein EcfA2